MARLNDPRGLSLTRTGDPRLLLSIEVAAELISMSTRHVIRLLDAGILTGRRDGRRRLIDRNSLLAYVASLPSAEPVTIPITQERSS